MSEQFPADPAAITAHALRIFSYQSDLEHASATLRQVSASDGAFGLMAGPLIAPLFQLVEVGEHLAISGAECALDKLGQTLVASARRPGGRVVAGDDSRGRGCPVGRRS